MTRPGAAAVVLALAAAPASAKTITVGGPYADFPFIAPAVAAAAPGDLIRVAPGVYREDLVLDRPVSIVGDGSPLLYGTGAGSVITITAPGCEVRGLRIEGSGTGQTNDMDAGVQVLSSGNRIVGNRMRRVFYGVVVASTTGNEVADNVIEGLARLPFGRRGDGVYVYRAPGTIVARNRISGVRDGIYFQYAPRGRATDNVVRDTRYALHDMFSDDARIAGNTFAGSSAGANIMNSRRIVLERNRFLDNRGVSGVGLTLKDCDGSLVRSNEMADNLRGLFVDGSSSNRFVDNTFRANDTAVMLFSSAEQNAFTGNQFRGNWSDLVLSGRDPGTRWSVNGRGNYWSRYRGFDFDGDGIGDAPHPLLGAFEKLEGANPAVRLFLQSPAAAGLELAARFGGPTPGDAVDARPLVAQAVAPASGPRPMAHPGAALLILASVGALTSVLLRETRTCSRSRV
ncbi:MAG: nitrous oxide reductase family maturation protein NosD [Betaproteobacteria bacterium]